MGRHLLKLVVELRVLEGHGGAVGEVSEEHLFQRDVVLVSRVPYHVDHALRLPLPLQRGGHTHDPTDSAGHLA